MDLHQLCAVLQACLSPDPEQRKAAESTLKQQQHQPGHLTALLRVAVEDGVDLAYRQVAAIAFKNLVKADWDRREAASPLTEADKGAVRENLTEGIIRCPQVVRVQLGECARCIVYSDYPHHWPALLQQVHYNLASQEQARIYGGLYVLRVLARKYEFKDEEERGPLHEMIESTFPLLLQIFQTLLASDSAAVGVAELLKLVCKVFWSSTYMAIPGILLQPQQFTGWMTAIHALILRPVPLEGMPSDADARKAWPWWKTKKWVLHISYRLFNRYGDPHPSSQQPPTDAAFAAAFARDCSLNFLHAHLQLMAQLAQGQYMSPRVVGLLLQYLTHAVKLSAAWKALKPSVPSLLTHVVFPLMCFDDEDERLWRDDPHEYIRKGYDIVEEFYSNKSAATNFVHELCSMRTKGNLEVLMAHAVGVLNQYSAAAASPAGAPQDLARRMDGAMLALGALAEILKHKALYKKQLEPMLTNYVLPLFGSPYGHLRAKAAWVAGVFADIDFREGAGTGQTFNTLFGRVVQALQDTDLPVQVDAVVAIRVFVDCTADEDIDKVKPLIPQLLNQFLKLMAEVENEELTFTLESIVEKFGEEMAPYAVGLCQHLATAFWRLAVGEPDQGGEGEGEDEDEDDAGAMAAFGCLRAISTVLESVSSLPQLYPQLEEILYPMMSRMLTTEGQDVLEEVLDIVSYFTYFSPAISPQLWSLWPLMHAAFNEWAIDFFEQMLVPMDNYISRATDVFLTSQNPSYLAQANQMIEKAMTEDLTTDSIKPAPKLMDVIMQNCRGRVDPCVGVYIGLALRKLPTAQTRLLSDLCVNVVASALWYNAALAVGALRQHGGLPAFFTSWFHMIFAKRSSGELRHFRRAYDKKVNVLGLLAVMTLGDEALPAEVAAGLPQLLAGTLHLLVALKEQQEAEGSSSEEGDEGNESGQESEEEEEVDLTDEQDDEADRKYLERLSRVAREMKQSREEGHAESGDDSEDEWSEEEEVAMPIDQHDPFVTFAEALNGLKLSNPGRFQALTATAEPAVQTALQGMMEHAASEAARKAAEPQPAAR